MTTYSVHIVPKDHAWFVFKPDNKPAGSYKTQRDAIGTAMNYVNKAKIGQIVLHQTGGSYRILGRKGLPTYASSRNESSLKSLDVKKAVSSVVRARLLAE